MSETSVVIPLSFSPLERIILTANGNLQRILSAYYGSTISVVIKKCERVDFARYDREVDILMGSQLICTATGEIVLHTEECREAIEHGSVGVGQLFRYLKVLPTFRLLAVGRSPTDKPLSSEGSILQHSSLWRRYELSSEQLTCTFTERFAPGFLDFQLQSDHVAINQLKK